MPTAAALEAAAVHAPVDALLQALSPRARVELERALTARLRPALSPAETRLAELGTLALMLQGAANEDETDRLPELTQSLYDERRKRGALSAEALAERYGSWRKVRRASWALLPDGRWRGRTLPWPANRPPPAYTLEEVRHALRRCALALGRRPTVEAYRAWRRARGPAAGRERLPAYGAIRRHYEGWRAAAADIPVTDLELAETRAMRFPAPTSEEAPSALHRLMALTEGELAAFELPADVDGSAMDPADLPIKAAAHLAMRLGGSLHWLAGHAVEPGAPPLGDVHFDPATLRRLRRHRRVSDATARHVAGYTSGPWAAVSRGTSSPSLRAVAQLAKLLGVEVDALCVPSPSIGGMAR